MPTERLSMRKIHGHKTIQMTLRYSHLSPGHLRNAVAAIDRAMTAPAESTSYFASYMGENAPPTPEPALVTARK